MTSTSTTLPSVVTFGDTNLTIIDRNGTPWVSDSSLGLKMTAIPPGAIVIQPDKLSKLIADPNSNIRRGTLPDIIRAAVDRLEKAPP